MTKEEIKTKIITLQKARTRFAISCIFLIAIPFAKKIEKRHEILRDEIVVDLKKYFKEKVDNHYFLNTEQFDKEWIENLKTEEIDTHLSFYIHLLLFLDGIFSQVVKHILYKVLRMDEIS